MSPFDRAWEAFSKTEVGRHLGCKQAFDAGWMCGISYAVSQMTEAKKVKLKKGFSAKGAVLKLHPRTLLHHWPDGSWSVDAPTLEHGYRASTARQAWMKTWLAMRDIPISEGGLSMGGHGS